MRLQEIQDRLTSRRKQKRLLPLITCLAVLVAAGTACVLIRPAVAQEAHCGLAEHTHTADCYTQLSAAERGVLACTASEAVHHHTEDCYDSAGSLLCGYADFLLHTHDDTCYDESGGLRCPLPEIQPHYHTASCYAAPEQSVSGSASPDDVEAEADAVSDAEPSEEAAELYAAEPLNTAEPVLICGRPESGVHQHTEDCFDETGAWVCGKLEVSSHHHTDACFETAASEPPLTCTDESPDHVHTPQCYGTWVLTCGMQEHTHTAACFTSGDDAQPADSISEDTDPSLPGTASGALNIDLLYGDQQPQSEHPDGVFYYTHTNMSGYIRLEPVGLDADLTDIAVTLSIPRQYVEKDSVNIPSFNTNSSSTQYEILPVEEDDDYYYARIHFTAYDKTQTLELPFVLSFLDDVVPDNYRLAVTASVSGGDTTQPSIYRPQYKSWIIEKFVNSNRYREFKEDGAEVVVTPQEENGNPYLDDLTYVDFAFTVNGCTYESADLHDWRDVCEVTLTDKLPVYTDKNDTEKIAVFDADKNPGWTLNADGTSVSKTYQGANSGDVLTQIYNDELHLRFPGLKFQEAADGGLFADLDNSVHLTAVPSNAAEGETRPEADDPLRFRMTSDPSTAGRFSKWATKGDIYDINSYKTNPYPWRVSLHNDQKKTTPLRHIVIQDREITENGKTVLKGLDEALKFVRLESDGHSALASGQTFADIIDQIVAYYTDGTTQTYTITQSDLTSNGHFSIEFDESKVCNGYEIIFRDDYEMLHGEGVEFQVYTVYRDPENTHVLEGQDKITYVNEARSINRYQNGSETVYVYLTQSGQYDMLPSTEELTIDKVTLVNDGSSTWDGIGGNTVGSTYAYVVRLRGTLLEPEVKEYHDIRIVDLLPDGVHFEKIHLIQQSTSLPSVLDGGKNYQPEIIENYHNSGRTAVIFHLNTENLRAVLNSKSGPDIYFGVTIDPDAHPGKIRNYVYVVGDDLDEYQGKDLQKSGGTEDIYDLNNNGRTDDRIAYGFDDATIIAAQSIYAEKFIAPAGSDNWSKQGLLVSSGSDFDYSLKVTNETGAEHTGLTLYDTLPHPGDTNIFAQSARGSEFSVRLRGPITPPEGYQVLYTTSEDVYQSSMQDMLRQNVWTDAVSDYADVTAFQITAEDGTVLAKNSVFEIRIPVQAASVLDDASLKVLHEKATQDQTSGTAAWLEAINAFGYQTNQTSAAKESNTVWARIPFAGFCVKKVDSVSGAALSGAQFTLRDADGQTLTEAVSGEDGLVQFRDLTQGTYTLTETKVPAGYIDQKLAITVTITQSPITMEYTVALDGAYPGSGTSEDPFLVANRGSYKLPHTGGPGVLPFCASGAALLLLAAAWLKKRRRA